MIGRASRRKRDRLEQELAHALQNAGFAAALPGAGRGRLVISLLGVDRRVACRARVAGFRELYRPLAGVDLLVVRAGLAEPLVITKFGLAVSIAKAAENSRKAEIAPANSGKMKEREVMRDDQQEPKIENLPARDDGFGGNDIDNDRLLQGQRLICIDGEWNKSDGAKIPPDKRYLVLGTAEGIQFWQDGQLVKEWIKKPNVPLPNLDELNATIPQDQWEEGINGPRPPYSHQWAVYLLDESDGSIWTHINNTDGAAIATRELRSKVRWKRGLMGGRLVLPRVTLGSRLVSQKWKKYGPDFVTSNDWHDPAPDLPPAASTQIEDHTEKKPEFNDPIGDIGQTTVEAIKDEIPEDRWTAIALELVSPCAKRDKTSKLHTALREGSKSFRYGFLFGMRGKRAGEIITATIRAARQVDPSYVGPSTNGGQALQRFEAATPGLKQLRQKLEAQAAKYAWVPGLDGRRVPTGAQYKALNRIVTSAEAIVCKRWLINVHDELCKRFRYGWNGDAVIAAWIHDELVCCCRPDYAEEIGEIMVQYAKEAGEHYGLKVPLDADFQVGNSWAGDLSDQHDASNDDEAAADRSVPPSQINGHAAAVPTATSTLVVPEQEQPETLERRLARIPLADLIGEPPINGKIGCPFHEDDTPSLHVYRDHYHCFGCGAHGGHLDWLREVEGLDDDAAVDVILHWQGRTSSRRQDNDARTLKLALALWQAAKPIADTLAVRYLADVRGIDVEELPADVPLRFHPRCPFGTGKQLPCLIALYRDVESDEPAGIHRIALTPEVMTAGGKVERRSLGRWPRPRAVKLWPATTILYVGEGIETVLAAATRLPYRDGALMRPAWAAVSTGGVSKFPVLPDVQELRLLLDHDAEGEACAVPCRDRWEIAGRKVTRLRPPQAGFDFNDVVIAKLQAAS
jgi:DNA polymerase family A/CHC2 zinc finger/Toprim domain